MQAEKGKAVPVVLALLDDEDLDLQRAAGKFMTEMPGTAITKGLTLDTRRSSNDYPRGYEVYVSFDGGSWGAPLVTGKGTRPITEIKFEKPVRTRFVRIVQTGSSDSWHWSIHELSLDVE